MSSIASPSPDISRSKTPDLKIKNKLVAIVGPTGIGKSEVALLLAQRLNGEIISADSMQVYKRMDIGTAKPDLEQRKKVPHHLLDIVPIHHSFTVAEYQSLARQVISQIHSRGKLPLLVGGSGLYVRAVIDNLNFPPQTKDSAKFREALYKKARKEGLPALFSELQRVDPVYAARIHSHDLKRIVRALEVYQATGRPFSDFQKDWQKWESIYNLKIIGITASRELLYRRIEERVERMLESGLLEETRQLVSLGYKRAITAKQALGYKELLEYLEGKVSLKEAVERIKRNTRHLARRQLIWFKKDPRIIWVEREKEDDAKSLADKVELCIQNKRENHL